MLLLNTYGYLWQCQPKICEASLRKYYSEIKINGNKKNSKMEQNKKYIMKKDVTIYDMGNHCHYTHFNMTDEIAKRLLAKNPKLAHNFSKIPEKIITAKEIIAIVETSDLEKLKEFEADIRVTVIKAIAKRKEELTKDEG